MIRAALLAFLLTGCTLSPGCFVGMTLIPPAPFVMCGVDAVKHEKDDGV